jgi:hypothetical protein
MENFRLKQVQMLLKEAGKSKRSEEILSPPQEGKIDSIIFKEILNELMDLEDFIYHSRPTHHLNQEDAQLFCDSLLTVRNRIDDILSDFGVIHKQDVEEEIKILSEKYLILTTKNSFKKVMTKLGADPQRIVVAGVPLQIEDMKEINPHLPENALNPIKKKITHIKNDIERKKGQFNVENILVVTEEDKAGQILAKRAQELYNAKTAAAESLKDISAPEFLKILSSY